MGLWCPGCALKIDSLCVTTQPTKLFSCAYWNGDCWIKGQSANRYQLPRISKSCKKRFGSVPVGRPLHCCGSKDLCKNMGLHPPSRADTKIIQMDVRGLWRACQREWVGRFFGFGTVKGIVWLPLVFVARCRFAFSRCIFLGKNLCICSTT